MQLCNSNLIGKEVRPWDGTCLYQNEDMAAYKSPPRPYKNKLSLWDNSFLYNQNLIQQIKFLIYIFMPSSKSCQLKILVSSFLLLFFLHFFFIFFIFFPLYFTSLQPRLNTYSYLFICFFVYLARYNPYGISLSYIVDRQLQFQFFKKYYMKVLIFKNDSISLYQMIENKGSS